MAESLLAQIQSAGGSSDTQLVIGPAFSQDTISTGHPCVVNGSSMFMAMVRVHDGAAGNGYGNQLHPEWFIVVVGDNNSPLTVIATYEKEYFAFDVAWATMTTTQLTIDGGMWSNTFCGVDGRVFCTA